MFTQMPLAGRGALNTGGSFSKTPLNTLSVKCQFLPGSKLLPAGS